MDTSDGELRRGEGISKVITSTRDEFGRWMSRGEEGGCLNQGRL